MLGGIQQTLARLLAAATGLGADAMMLMVGGVTLALRRANAARDNTRLDLCAPEIWICLSLAGEHSASHRADCAAVEAQTNRLDQVRHVRLAQRVVCAAGTDLEALGARLDTFEQYRLVERRSLLAGMQVHHSPHQRLDALCGSHGFTPKRMDGESAASIALESRRKTGSPTGTRMCLNGWRVRRRTVSSPWRCDPVLRCIRGTDYCLARLKGSAILYALRSLPKNVWLGDDVSRFGALTPAGGGRPLRQPYSRCYHQATQETMLEHGHRLIIQNR